MSGPIPLPPGQPPPLFFQIFHANGTILEVPKGFKPEFIVGRRSQMVAQRNDLFIDDPHTSRRHCRLFQTDGGEQWFIEDLGSTAGTRVDGKPAVGPTPCTTESTIHVGTCRLTFSRTPRFPHLIPREAWETLEQEPPPLDRESNPAVPSHRTTPPSPGPDLEATLLFPAGAPAEFHPLPAEPTLQAPAAPPTPPAEPTLQAPATPPPPPAEPTLQAPATETLTVPGGVIPSPGDGGTLVLEPAQRVGGAEEGPTLAAPLTLAHPLEEMDDQAPTVQGGGWTMPAPPTLAGEADTPPSPPVGAASPSPDPPGAFPSFPEEALPLEEWGDEVEPERPPPPTGDPITLALGSEFMEDLLNLNFLDTVTAQELLAKTQGEGGSLLRTLAQQPVRYVNEICSRITQRGKLELIADEEQLQSQAWDPPWLPFNRAEILGVVMLRPQNPERNRYAALDPFDPVIRDWVTRFGGKPAHPVMVLPEVFTAALRYLKSHTDDSNSEVGVAIDISRDEEMLIRERVGQVDVPQMVNYFLHRARMQGASDIHIEPTEDLLIVRNRVDGVLHEEITMPPAFHPEVVSRIKIMSRMDVAEKRRPQDGRFRVIMSNNPIDVRVSSYPTVFGEKFVLRLLDPNALRPSINGLGMLDRDLELLKEKLEAPFGLIIISGPTGSGKTTTLYSCLSSMDRTTKNILTVEDPVEYRIKGIHQMQVNSRIGLNFASGLRTILRQDPDVIMVGEIRDGETADMAVQAALTGHIVFSTIHANDSAGVVTRLLDMEIEPFLVASSLSLAIAQRLVRRICAHCRIAVGGEEVLRQLKLREGVTPERLAALGIEIDPYLDYVQGLGCQRCRNTGYLGRQAVFELLEITDEGRSIILSPDFNATSLKQANVRRGMSTLIGHGLRLVEDEVTTFSEVIRVLGENG